jgi:hypothetical protein
MLCVHHCPNTRAGNVGRPAFARATARSQAAAA